MNVFHKEFFIISVESETVYLFRITLAMLDSCRNILSQLLHFITI